MNTNSVQEFAANSLGVPVCEVRLAAVGGGDINQSFVASSQGKNSVFIKANGDAAPLLSECNALRRFQDLSVDFYPRVLDFEQRDDGAFLALNFVELDSIGVKSAKSVADALTAQHSITSERYGWYENGHIGYSVQINDWRDDWIVFFSEMRLLPQLSMAIDNGMESELVKKVERVMRALADYIDSDSIQPALLHGDLWTGNLAIDRLTRQPFLFDPAPYFGDPEVDIAMTRLFGSLPGLFYESYKSQLTDKSIIDRHAVYNLYHALNHFNIFGAGYGSMVENFCTELRA